MNTMPLPSIDALDVFEKCVKAYPDEFTEGDLALALPFIEKLYASYHDCLSNQDITSLKRSEDFGKFTAEKMKMFYQAQLVGTEGVCRDEYNKIMAAAHRKTCPMCSSSTATVLDHHAPKQTYYAHAINPKNLVPVCSRCNIAKMNTMPDLLHKQFIHPYYDDFSKFSWFEMDFINENPIEVLYRCKPNEHLDEKVREKLKSHFSRLKLDELYSSYAVVILQDMQETFSPYLEKEDWDSVEADINKLFEMVQRRPNSWEYALYSRLLTERWFIEGGFDNI